jgi:hypothetical protein
MCLQSYYAISPVTEAPVRHYLLLSFALLLTAPAQAQTMYKCVGANGKIVYSDLPCPHQAKMAKEFDVPAPETQEQSEARLAKDKERRRRADLDFQERHASRQRSLDRQNSSGGDGPYVDTPGRRAPSNSDAEMAPTRRAGTR